MALLLILDSLGTSELMVILVVALIFFGPRKLPQISKQIGKSLAEFRRASEDFKRTWEREVSLETQSEAEPPAPPYHPDSVIETTVSRGQIIEPVPSVTAVASTPESIAAANETSHNQPLNPPAGKQDWF